MPWKPVVKEWKRDISTLWLHQESPGKELRYKSYIVIRRSSRTLGGFIWNFQEQRKAHETSSKLIDFSTPWDGVKRKIKNMVFGNWGIKFIHADSSCC